MNFSQAMDAIESGFKTWREKPHNERWWRKIDGTPIPNDLSVNIAEAICSATKSAAATDHEECAPSPSPQTEGQRAAADTFRRDVFKAAECANARFGQWMPQQWLEIFIDEMEKGK